MTRRTGRRFAALLMAATAALSAWGAWEAAGWIAASGRPDAPEWTGDFAGPADMAEDDPWREEMR